MSISMKDIIIQRKSVRTFDGNPLTADDRKKIEDYIGTLTNPFGVPVEFRLLDAKENSLSSPVIVGESTYLAAKVKKVKNYEIAFGYSFEKACLYAKSLGIGTVMLAATLSRKAFEKAMDIQEDEVLPVASPIGYPAARRSIREDLMRKTLKADERIAFEKIYFDGSFEKGLQKENAGCFAEPLDLARLAPSATNKQPWRAVVEGEKVHFYEARTIQPTSLGDIQKVDVGIALAHFDIVLAENGITGSFSFSDPGLKLPENVEYIITYARK